MPDRARSPLGVLRYSSLADEQPRRAWILSATILALLSLVSAILFLFSGVLPLKLRRFYLPGFIAVFVLSITAVILRTAARRLTPSSQRPRLGGLVMIALAGPVLVAGVLIIQILNSPAFWMDHEKAGCFSHLSNIKEAMMSYVANKHRFPDDLGELQADFDFPPDVFLCPGAEKSPLPSPTTRELANDLARGRRTSYCYVGKGVSPEGKIRIVIYEPLSNHGKGAYMIDSAGTLFWLGADEARHVIAQLQAGVNPPEIRW